MNSSDSVRTTRFSNPRVAGSIPAAPTIQRKPVQSQQLIPVAKPQSSDATKKLYLRSALQHTLAKVEADTQPLTRKQWADYERLRQLARMLRQAGIVPWWAPVGFAFMAMLIIVALLWHAPKAYVYAAPDNTFRVIEQIDDYAFVLQRVEHGVPQIPWTYHFCTDYKPLFQPGMSLIWFAYDDRGSCISIAPKDRGYVIDRGSDHWPKLARNCKRGTETTPTLCDGKPQFD